MQAWLVFVHAIDNDLQDKRDKERENIMTKILKAGKVPQVNLTDSGASVSIESGVVLQQRHVSLSV